MTGRDGGSSLAGIERVVVGELLSRGRPLNADWLQVGPDAGFAPLPTDTALLPAPVRRVGPDPAASVDRHGARFERQRDGLGLVEGPEDARVQAIGRGVRD